MREILVLLQNIAPVISATVLQQMSHVIYGMLISNGRLTMLEISRWTEAGGSYRTLQRWYHSKLPWLQILWVWFTSQLWVSGHEYIAAGDEVVFGKAGKETHGIGRFFSGLQQRMIPGLSFFVFSVIDVKERQSYPLQAVQMVKEPGEQKKEAQKTPAAASLRPVGRPKGSKNKKAENPVLSAELLRIQPVLQAFLAMVAQVLSIRYLVLDGHFGNYPSAWLVNQSGLHLVSKLRQDAALYEPFSGKYSGRGPHPKYGDKVNVRKMPKQYLKSDTKQDGMRTQIYQAAWLNKAFSLPINVVVVLKTNLRTQAQAHVIFFSTDVNLAYEKIIAFYALRFQIEFNFRDAKQYWGLDDFMNVKEVAVTNAANLAFFMVNFSASLLRGFRENNPAFSILDLKSHYRGCRYASEIIKLLPQKPDAILLADIFEQIARLGAIHPVLQPAADP